MARVHVCGEIGCPHLMPCPIHGRNRGRTKQNGWTHKHNGHAAEHKRWRKQALAAQPCCSLCGSRDKLDVHHLADGSPQVLCNPCHCRVDKHARPR